MTHIKKIYFAADMHLKPGKQELQNRDLIQFFDYLGPDSSLILLGDAFNGWFERGNRIVGDYSEVISIFRHYIEHDIEIHHVCGNRDFTFGSCPSQNYPGFYSGRLAESESILSKCGVKLHGDTYTITHEDVTITTAHGDSLCSLDINYQRLRWLLQGWIGKAVAKHIPFFIADFIVSAVQQKDITPHFGIIPYARNITDEAVYPLMRNGANLVVCGHLHHEQKREIALNGKKCLLQVLPGWGCFREFGLLEGTKVKIINLSCNEIEEPEDKEAD